MQHPDEGTIHAWLDGALDDHEAAQVAAHVASCADCGARVVEARGLIAGASRVLLALDAVPGGVMPASSGGPEATPPRDGERPGPERATRHWWRRRGITPALAAAAAVVFVAAGSALVMRVSEPPATFDRAERVTMVLPPTATPGARPSAQPRPGVTAGQVAVPRAAAPAPTGVAMAPMAADTTRAPSSRPAPAPKATAASGAADRVAAAELTPNRDEAMRSLPDSGATAPPSERLKQAMPRGLAERTPSQIQRKAPADLPAVSPTAVASAEVAMEQRATAGAAPPAPRPSLMASFAGCYRVVSGDTGTTPRVFVLDTTAAAVAGDSVEAKAFALVRAYVVRDTSARASGRWSALGPTARVRWDGLAVELELRAGTADRFEGIVRQSGRAATLTLERCGRR